MFPVSFGFASRKAGVNQPKPWLEAAHPSAVLLDTAMVAASLIQQANAALEARLVTPLSGRFTCAR